MKHFKTCANIQWNR